MRGVVIFSAALMLVPVSLAEDQESYRYAVSGERTAEAAGTGLDVGGFCTSDVPEGPALGGLCGVEAAPGETVRVRVLDDVNGPIGFHVGFLGPQEEVFVTPCAEEIDAEGSLTLVVPEGCSELNVFVGPSGVLGTIVIERL